jgi:hypothetical protein
MMISYEMKRKDRRAGKDQTGAPAVKWLAGTRANQPATCFG